MKNLLTFFVFCILISSCRQIKSEKQIVKESIEADFKSDQELLKSLVFKPQLSLDEQKYIQGKADEFNEKVRLFVKGYSKELLSYEERDFLNRETCFWIVNNVNELSKLPLSREREGEREREKVFL